VIVDHDGRPFELVDALKEIRNLVDQLISKEQPLPSELEDIDAESRIYLLALCDRREIKSDDLHKATRGILELEDLLEAGLIIKGRAGRGRAFEVKQPAERFQQLTEIFRERPTPQGELFGDAEHRVLPRARFVDYVHLLMALAEGGDPLAPWLERFRGETPRLRAACDYLSSRNKTFAPALRKVRDLIEVGPLFR
jgi:putative DNA methylase